MDRHTVVRDGKPRCRWCNLANPLYVSYHDTEWGRPVRSDKIDAEVMEHAPKLKVIVRAGAGYDNIDLAAATQRGICVMNTPGQNSNA